MDIKSLEVPGVGYYQSKHDNSYQMIINLMNGYSGKEKNGFLYYNACCVKEIQDEFTRILMKNGVNNVYYVGTHKEAIEILDLEGSLRCLSVSGSVVFGHLGSMFGCNNMLSTTADVNNIAEEEEIIVKDESHKNNSDIDMSHYTSSEESGMEILESKSECNDRIYEKNWSTIFLTHLVVKKIIIIF